MIINQSEALNNTQISLKKTIPVTQTSTSTSSISSAYYDAANGQLIIYGTFSANDYIDMSKLTLTGEGGHSYTLSAGAGRVTNDNVVSLGLNAIDAINVNGLLNKAGNSSVDHTSFNLSAAAGWDSTSNAAADLINPITTANLTAPSITNATYDASTHVLRVTGNNMVKNFGPSNDIDVSKLFIVGEGNVSHKLETTGNVEIIDSHNFAVTLSGADIPAVDVLLNKNGSNAQGGTPYNLVAFDDWNGSITGGETSDISNPIIVTGKTLAPVITTSPGNTQYVEGNNTVAAVAIDQNLTLTDADSPVLTSASFAITGNFHPDQDQLSFARDGRTMGSIYANYDAAHGVLTLTSSLNTSSLVEWQNALRAVNYSNTSEAPDTSNRTISFSANDGNNTSTVVSKVIQVSAVDDSPVITTTNTPHPYIENQAGVLVDAGLTLHDVDSATLASATLYMNAGYYKAGEDILMFNNNHQNMGNITASSFDQTTGIMHLVSEGATATVAEWQNALRSVQYTNLSEAPVSSNYRAVKFVVSDGHSDSYLENTPYTSYQYLQVIAVNDAPVIHAPGNFTVMEDQSSVLKGFSFSDVDALDYPVTATLRASSGSLNASTSSGVTVTGSGTSTLKLDGPIEYINSFIAANKLSFTSALHDHTDVTLNMTIDDNGYWYTTNDQNPVHLTDQKTASIKVTHINQAPVITSSTGAVQFVEGNNTPSAAVKIDTALTLTDADNTSLSSATVAISGNFRADQDKLVFTNDGNMGNISAIYDAAHGVMNLASTGASATVAQWQAALRAVSYTNSSETPDTSTRDISYSANDGSDTSAVVNKQIAVTAINDAPLLHNVPTTVSIESIKSLFSEVSVTDADGNYGTLSIQLATPKAGSLLELGIVAGSHYDAQTGFYQISGSLTNLETALHQLAFIPAEGHFTPGSGEDMAITLTITDSDRASTVYNLTHIVAETAGKPVKLQTTIEDDVYSTSPAAHTVELVGVLMHDSLI